MIEHKKETLLTLTEAAARLPRRRGGKKVSPATLYRWASPGCRGQRLEVLQVGGTKCTSLEALQRFFDRLTWTRDEPDLGRAGGDRPAPIRRHRRDDKAVEAELDRLGF
jgi:hypothetical protein